MRLVLALAAAAILAACGADGEPERPAPAGPVEIRISGDARFGIVREW